MKDGQKAKWYRVLLWGWAGGWVGGAVHSVVYSWVFWAIDENQVSCIDRWTKRLCAIITARIIAENYSPPLLLIPLSRKGSDMVAQAAPPPLSQHVRGEHDDALLLRIRLFQFPRGYGFSVQMPFHLGFLNMIYLHFCKSKTNGTQVRRGWLYTL